MPDQTLRQQLQSLIDARLVRAVSPETFEFQHALTREAVYLTLLKRHRAEYHALAADIIERQEADEEQTAVLAFHYRQAANWPKALEFAQRAGANAQKRHASREAAEHFTHAMEAASQLGRAPDLQLLRERGQAYDTLGAFEGALGDYDLGLRLAGEAGAAQAEWQAMLDLGFLWAGRDYARTGVHFQQALELARRLGDPLTVASSLNRLGNWLVNTGQMAAGLKMHQEALHIFEMERSQSGMAATHDLLGLVHLMSGNLLAGNTHYELAINHYRRLGDKRGLAASLAVHSSVAGYCDLLPWTTQDVETSRHESAEALALAKQIGWLAGQSEVQWHRALTLAAYGELGEALVFGTTALQLANSIEHRQWTIAAHYALGQIHLLLLAPEAAVRHLETAQAVACELGSNWWISVTGAYLVLARLQLGQVAAARVELQSVLTKIGLEPDWLTRPPRTLPERYLLWAWGEAALAQGQPAEALAVTERLIDSTADPVELLLKLKGAALARVGQLALAEECLEQALEAGRAHRRLPVLWQIHQERGRLASRLGRVDLAHQEFEAARRALEALAQTFEPGPARETFLIRAQLRLDGAADTGVQPD